LASVDANAVLALLRDEPAAGDVEGLLRAQPLISAVNMAEVVDVFVRTGGSFPALADAYDRLRSAGLRIAPADEEISMSAGEIRARYYHRTNAALSMADCFALATSNTFHTDLATSDPAVVRLAREIGFGVHALPDSTGRTP
jgi:PIN domain nuclease of toxin-antitoxin system